MEPNLEMLRVLGVCKLGRGLEFGCWRLNSSRLDLSVQVEQMGINEVEHSRSRIHDANAMSKMNRSDLQRLVIY